MCDHSNWSVVLWKPNVWWGLWWLWSFPRGTQREILRKRPKHNNKVSIQKAFCSHFKHFGRLLGKIYLLLTPSKTDERVSSQQATPTTCNLTYWRMSRRYWLVWVKAIGQYFFTKLFIVSFNLWGCGCRVTIYMRESTKSLQIYRVIAYLQIQRLV